VTLDLTPNPFLRSALRPPWRAQNDPPKPAKINPIFRWAGAPLALAGRVYIFHNRPALPFLFREGAGG
jgi:hypothetical protein